MTTEKKNQHYIPKFYLRYFAYKGREQIGIHNTQSGYTFSTAKLKKQGSKNFFYGNDGVIEEHLGKLESKLALVIKRIRDNHLLPKKNSKDYVTLLHFIALTHLRNPVAMQQELDANKQKREKVAELYPYHETKQLIPEITNIEAISASLLSVSYLVRNLLDLECKILINKTKKGFITSDLPVVRYNQFLEERKWPHGKSGFGKIGLQIFIPLSHELCLILYDSAIYKVGNRKEERIVIDDVNDIDQLNMLQFTNCFQTVFFSDKVTEDYIQYLKRRSVPYQKANIVNSTTKRAFVNGDVAKEKIIILSTITDNQIKLNTKAIKVHAQGKKKVLSTSLAQYRAWPEFLNKNKDQMLKEVLNL
ncbi:Protein of unknown function [Marivirga sericea]|uniref:DUF4238 domain-containing protein n=1 Tax=Marivirga sericea TaxID=1028 RepID=A0A1X7JLN4_9BACT|nr:DUF4238 domain-containing protein [Marivirga sericea]SMG28821.1 Protein of unknown function [Marivirga sericea]